MKNKELYEFDAVNEKLKGISKWIVNSKNVKLVALFPIGDGKIRLLTDHIMVKKTNLGYGFNRSRKFLQDEMPGCDYYYEIAVKPETIDLRKSLVNNRISVNINEEGIGTIVGKIDKDAFEYNKDDIAASPIKDEISKIVTFYEYNPIYESPTFGTTYELINTKDSINGSPIWKKVPKILQNQSGIDYAERALRKGVRTVILIDDNEMPRVIEMLEKEGKMDNLKEFITIPGMEEDYIVESNSLALRNEISKIK